MQPQQIYVPPPKGQNPYDFIMNPAKPPKRKLLNGGSSLASKLLLGVGTLFILIILGAIVFRFLGGGSGTSTSSLLSLAQTQNEIIRIAETGTDGAQDQTAKNLAINTKLSLESNQEELINYLKSHGVKVTDKKLVLLKNQNTDKQLATALSGGNYDATFIKIIRDSLNSYSAALSRTYNASSKPPLKKLLSQQYQAAQLLITQSKELN